MVINYNNKTRNPYNYASKDWSTDVEGFKRLVDREYNGGKAYDTSDAAVAKIMFDEGRDKHRDGSDPSLSEFLELLKLKEGSA